MLPKSLWERSGREGQAAQEEEGHGGGGQAGLHQEEVKEVVQKKIIILHCPLLINLCCIGGIFATECVE